MDAMDPHVEAALKVLDEVEPVPTGPVELSPEYLANVKRMENHPANRSGSDKSWVGAALRRNRAFFERARLL